METKRCTQCYVLKPMEDFYKDSHQSDGRTSACKPCRNRQNVAARRKRLLRSRGLLIEEDTSKLFEHNLRLLKDLLGGYKDGPPSMTLRTKQVEAVLSDPQGIVIRDGWALIETKDGRVSRDLKRCSVSELARLLELKLIRVISREDVNV